MNAMSSHPRRAMVRGVLVGAAGAEPAVAAWLLRIGLLAH